MPSLTSLATSVAKTAAKPAGAALLIGRRIAEVPRSKPKRVVTTGRAAVAGGVAAGAAGAVGILLRRRGGSQESAQTPAAGPEFSAGTPGVANYDAAGPPSNTATAVPVVDGSAEPLAIDEEAEVSAAAAEAANIGGPEIDYASADPDMTAGDAQVAPFEAGGGEAEGFEQAEADLVDSATSDVGPGTRRTGSEQRIDEAIEAASDPSAGETPDPASPHGDAPSPDEGR